MAHTGLQLVWFKRDLRVADHAPLLDASRSGPVLALYIVEPALWREPDASGRQWAFVRESLVSLDQALKRLGGGLVIRHGDAVAVIEALLDQLPVAAVHSHQETGNAWTFARDLAVTRLLKRRGIPWREPRQFGVVRGLKKRERWASQWEALIGADPLPAPSRLDAPLIDLGVIPDWPHSHLNPDICPGRQRGGRAVALELLDSFLSHRGERYSREMSSPLSAEHACSRLSAHLAHGCLSLRELTHRVRTVRAGLQGAPSEVRSSWPRSLQALESRLHWHCHFIQKLESEPAIEFQNVNRGYDGLRENDFDRGHFNAWASGQTGWPFVDACMRALIETGWINFRMRAMLMAVSSYHLWLHWREPALHLARLFTDYEPGIHFSQAQMQSGVTGINIPRIYNPIKQSLDQDPDGVFIRRYVPEIAALPNTWIHTPWLAPAALRESMNYPAPRVDHIEAARIAKARLSAWRRGTPGMSALNQAVLVKHGSKKRNVAVRAKRPDPQPDLFG
jgi:deoxyribodipyrimidine photo-lyase